MKVLFVKKAKGSYPTQRLRKFVGQVEGALGKSHPALAKADLLVVVFVSPAQMRELNRRFRGKDRPTDVLSFASADPEALGELVICPQVIRRQAKSNGWSDFHEYAYMILHGMLHLLGYDHEKDDRQAERMYRLQDKTYFQILK